MDKYFQVEVIRQTPNPQQAIWAAAKQDYSEDFIWSSRGQWLSEADAGEWIVQHLLKGGRGHWGPLEHVQIEFNAGWFPHSTMQQIRTHRHISFDVQSGRFTGKRFLRAHDEIGMLDLGFIKDRSTIEEVFYIRPVGEYSDRHGTKYTVTQEQREEDIEFCWQAICRYRNRVTHDGYSAEHARGMIPFDFRQHWVMSANLRALIHLLVIRGKADVQLESIQLCELMLPHFKAWAPEVYAYFERYEWKKGRLAP